MAFYEKINHIIDLTIEDLQTLKLPTNQAERTEILQFLLDELRESRSLFDELIELVELAVKASEKLQSMSSVQKPE